MIAAIALAAALALTQAGASTQATQGVTGPLPASQSSDDAWVNGRVAYSRSDLAEAVRWFRLAAEQGNADAQVRLGWMYEIGDGVERNYGEAARLYRLAANGGNASAQNNLGNLYRTGRGVERNDAEADRWYQLADDQGFSDNPNAMSPARPPAPTVSDRILISGWDFVEMKGWTLNSTTNSLLMFTTAARQPMHTWVRFEKNDPSTNIRSWRELIQIDCVGGRFRSLSRQFYAENNLLDLISSSDETLPWQFPPPGSVGDIPLKLLCDSRLPSP